MVGELPDLRTQPTNLYVSPFRSSRPCKVGGEETDKMPGLNPEAPAATVLPGLQFLRTRLPSRVQEMVKTDSSCGRSPGNWRSSRLAHALHFQFPPEWVPKWETTTCRRGANAD